MRYAISYVSTATQIHPTEIVNALLDKTMKYNNQNDITDILLLSEGNFFQLLEGEETKIKDLYSRIAKDPRHTNIIKFIGKAVIRASYDGYICEVITGSIKYNSSKFEYYYTTLGFRSLFSEGSEKSDGSYHSINYYP